MDYHCEVHDVKTADDISDMFIFSVELAKLVAMLVITDTSTHAVLDILIKTMHSKIFSFLTQYISM